MTRAFAAATALLRGIGRTYREIATSTVPRSLRFRRIATRTRITRRRCAAARCGHSSPTARTASAHNVFSAIAAAHLYRARLSRWIAHIALRILSPAACHHLARNITAYRLRGLLRRARGG